MDDCTPPRRLFDGGDGVDAPRAVAVQVDPFESKGLKPDFHFIGSRVETRRFQAYGSTEINLYSPHLGAPLRVHLAARRVRDGRNRDGNRYG